MFMIEDTPQPTMLEMMKQMKELQGCKLIEYKRSPLDFGIGVIYIISGAIITLNRNIIIDNIYIITECK